MEGERRAALPGDPRQQEGRLIEPPLFMGRFQRRARS